MIKNTILSAGFSLLAAPAVAAEPAMPSEFHIEDIDRYVMSYQCVEYKGDGQLRAIFKARDWQMPMKQEDGRTSWLMTGGPDKRVPMKDEHIDNFRRTYSGMEGFPPEVLEKQLGEFLKAERALELGEQDCNPTALIS